MLVIGILCGCLSWLSNYNGNVCLWFVVKVVMMILLNDKVNVSIFFVSNVELRFGNIM